MDSRRNPWRRGNIGVDIVFLKLELKEKKRNGLQKKSMEERSIFKCPSVGGVWKLEKGVPTQVSSSSLDRGSKQRGPSPKALV
ncbi:hypothetical protein TNCV_1199561 [Trichonephila clavipes]|uniref:Uncharacterized protein n=1 Tax=Trichonephila clavipes TaxID=2585209 RepID=A0A8X6VDR7_TRICX|nr:hypothetical protein TNCV_1199561 [Trichonephila clavipes]